MPAKGKKNPAPGVSPLASYDLGNASAKIKTADLATEFRSIAGRLSQSHSFGEHTSPLVFTFDGETLVFGDDARDLIDGEPVAYTDMSRYTDGFYRKLFAAALWRSFQHIATEGVVYPIVVCSIPVSEFADGKAEDVKKTVNGEYQIDGLDGKTLYVTVKPENLIIVPEGAGSYFQALYTEGSELATREVAIIDIGYYTTDLTLWNRGNYVTGSARSAKHGVRQVAMAVHQYLRKQFGYEGDVWAVDSALEAGHITIGSKRREFTDQRDTAFANLLEDIFAFYRSNKGSRTPSVVILSGGGAQGIFQFVSHALRADGWLVSANPRRANADGAYLFLEHREQARTKTNA